VCRDHTKLQGVAVAGAKRTHGLGPLPLGKTHHRNIQYQLFDRRPVDLLNAVKILERAEKFITSNNE
jgi:hypothetical protein